MKYTHLLFLLFLFYISISFSQEDSKTSSYYSVFDAYTAYENKGVFNGLEHIDEFPEMPLKAESNHKFYGAFNFSKGYVLYNGQPYYNLKMKYNLLHDLVLLQFTNKKVNQVKLSSGLISEFVLLEGKFVRLENNKVLKPYYKNGFFKEAFSGNAFSLFVKYDKEKLEDFRNRKVYYRFLMHQFYFLKYQDSFHKINSKRDIIKLLPNLEKPIKRFFKKSPKLFRKNKELFLANLFRDLDGISKQSIKN